MGAVSHSFELLPPRSAASAAAMPAVIDALAATGPDFFSVTYGAAGSRTEGSFELVRAVRERTGVEVMAHLTCTGLTHAEASALVRRFLDDGVLRFLAIRGDPVPGRSAGDLATAAELVQLVHRVQSEREPWSARRLPGRGVHVQQEGRTQARVAVAAFVNGHPDSRTPDGHLDALLAKQVAGADLAITQLFFEAADYAVFVRRARARGITIPIVPGVMPVTSPARLRRTLELSGEAEPRELAAALEAEPSEAGRYEIGVAHATALCAALIDAGAPSLHLYPFNRATAVVDVLDRLGLTTPLTKETT